VAIGTVGLPLSKAIGPESVGRLSLSAETTAVTATVETAKTSVSSGGHFSSYCYQQRQLAVTALREESIEATARDVDALVLLSEVLNYDFARTPLDEPFSDEELAELSFQGFRDRVKRQLVETSRAFGGHP
jgi:hypothetical protein